jgi:hypothetical protein
MSGARPGDGTRSREQLRTGIEGEIATNRHASVIARARPMCARLVELQDETSRLALAINIEFGGEWIQADEIFDTGEQPDTLRARFQMLYQMSNFLGTLAMFNPRLRGELFKKYPGRTPETWAVDAA